MSMLMGLALMAFSSGAQAATDPGTTWMSLGDSQTAGRAPGDAVSSPPIAVENILVQTDGISPSNRIYGLSGRSLQNTAIAYNDRTGLSGLSWVHFQESGNQDTSGQTTPEEYAATFEQFVRDIDSESPDAIISTETAFSFGREDEEFRNWDAYNAAQRDVIDALALEGITVLLTDVDSIVHAVQAELSPVEVWYQSGETNAYHYTNTGNLAVALGLLQALGYDLSAVDLSLIPDSEVAAEDQALLIATIEGLVEPPPPPPPPRPRKFRLHMHMD